jgi:uncharacterized membrane protein HdeD (DUF308 family)
MIMTTVHFTGTTPKESYFPWWLIVLQGFFAALIGLLLLISPGITIVVMVQFMGFYWLIGGLFTIVNIFLNRAMWGWKLVGGLIGIIAGFAVIQNPLWSALVVPSTLVIFLGISGILIGAVYMAQAFSGAGWGAAILGILSALFGLVLLANPILGAVTLTFVLGLIGLVGGITAMVFSFFRLR